MHYVIGDVHGCYKQLIELVEKIEQIDQSAEFIFLGDIIDRGEDVLPTIWWFMEHITPDGKYQSLRGNHEQLAIEWFEKYNDWKSKNDDIPMPETHYDFSSQMVEAEVIGTKKLDDIIAFFKSLPLTKELSIETRWGKTLDFQIAHAWYDQENVDRETFEKDAIWRREMNGNNKSDKIIIHGHTPTCSRTFIDSEKKGTVPGRISYRKNAINMDTGCCFEVAQEFPNMMGALCLETLEEIYLYSIEELYKRVTKIYKSDKVYWNPKKYEEEYPTDNEYRSELLKRAGYKGGTFSVNKGSDFSKNGSTNSSVNKKSGKGSKYFLIGVLSVLLLAALWFFVVSPRIFVVNKAMDAFNKDKISTAVEIFENSIKGGNLEVEFVDRMKAELDECRDSYLSNKMSYEDSISYVSKFKKFDNAELKEYLNTVEKQLTVKKDGLGKIENIRELYNSGLYIMCIANCKEVGSEDEYFEEATDILNKCKNNYKLEILKKADDFFGMSEYSKALKIVKDAESIIGVDEELSTFANKCVDAMKVNSSDEVSGEGVTEDENLQEDVSIDDTEAEEVNTDEDQVTNDVIEDVNIDEDKLEDVVSDEFSSEDSETNENKLNNILLGDDII